MSACPPLLANWAVSQVSRKENLEELTSRPPTRIRAHPKPFLIVERARLPTTAVCIQEEYVGRLRPAVCRCASGRDRGHGKGCRPAANDDVRGSRGVGHPHLLLLWLLTRHDMSMQRPTVRAAQHPR